MVISTCWCCLLVQIMGALCRLLDVIGKAGTSPNLVDQPSINKPMNQSLFLDDFPKIVECVIPMGILKISQACQRHSCASIDNLATVILFDCKQFLTFVNLSADSFPSARYASDLYHQTFLLLYIGSLKCLQVLWLVLEDEEEQMD
eukprot:c30039_g1_i1 orf=360-797(-)